jgi:hypothetical protein
MKSLMHPVTSIATRPESTYKSGKVVQTTGATSLQAASRPSIEQQVATRTPTAVLWGGLLVVVSQPLRLVVSGTEPWLAFARWATGVAG